MNLPLKKNVVVTGGCGYIGSHVARAFKEAGDHVVVIDNVKREHTLVNIDGYLIEDFASDAALSYIQMARPDIIVHCAGTSLVGPSMTNPAKYYNNNVVKTIRMMEVVKNMDTRPSIMFSSSASVYGHGGNIALGEHSRIAPISPYGSTKATCEMILNDYGRAYSINTICFRYFNAAGAHSSGELGQEPDATHVIARVLEASINGRAFSINGSDYDTFDGTCVRDYVHVWDIAQAHLRAASYLDRETEASPDDFSINEVFNLGTNNGISTKEIVDYVVDKYGIPFVNYGPRRAGDPAILIADASDAARWLGWVPVNSGIAQIIDSAHKWYTR
jgi:UDP-glucose-4-epimerase GalE